MTTRTMAPLALACALALAGLPAVAGQPGNLMQMTTTMRMQMPGMGQMAPMTHSVQVCTSAKRPDPSQMMQRQGDCKVSDYKVDGDTISYHMTCAGRTQMSGDGTFHMLGGGNIQGHMHIEGNEGGQSMAMDMDFDGKRVGSCDYTPPAHNGR